MLRHALPVALPALLIALLSACGQESTPPTVIRPAMVVQPQPASAAVDSYPGEVRARFEPELAFRIGGKVSKRLVEEGQRVKADQPLAELDPQDVRLQLEATRAQMAAAEANLNLVKAERDRYKTLLDRQMVSHSQYDNAENLYRSGLARVKQMRAEFDVAGNQAGYSVLRATQDGVVAKRQVEVGQVVAAGQTVFTVAADGEREVLISLPEQNFGRFAVGRDRIHAGAGIAIGEEQRLGGLENGLALGQVLGPAGAGGHCGIVGHGSCLQVSKGHMVHVHGLSSAILA